MSMTKQEAIELISSMVLRMETLETRNSDRDDFHELAVWEIKAALQQAYQAGYNQAKEGNPNE